MAVEAATRLWLSEIHHAFLYCKKTVQFINQVYFHFTDLHQKLNFNSSTTTFDRTEQKVDLFLSSSLN